MPSLIRLVLVAPDEPLRPLIAPRRRPGAPAYFSPAALLAHHHGRRPLRCDQGAIRNNLAAAQTTAAHRPLQPSLLTAQRSALRQLPCA